MAGDKLDPGLLKLAGVLVLGALAPLLDSTIVNVAVGTLGRELDAPVTTVQWVATGYLLALAMAIPLTGWAIDRFGGKPMWLAALAIFLTGSVLCGAAWNIEALIAFRVLQGAGAGLMMPIMQTILFRAAGGQRLGRLMAVITLPALAGPILGPVVGGLIAGHLSWRWIFYVNVPLCLVAIALAWRMLPDDRPEGGAVLDWAGFVLLSPGLAGLVYGLAQAGGHGFGQARVLLPICAGAVLVAGFVARSLRARTPLIDLRVFRSRSFSASSALLFLAGLALYGPMLLLPLYYQQVRGQSVVMAGLMLVPQGLGSLLARAAGSLIDRIGPRPVVFGGFALTALGTAPFVWAGSHTGYFELAAALMVRGIGLSSANMAVMVGAYQGVPRELIPDAGSTTRIMQQLGGSFGAAVLATILAADGSSAAFGWALALTAPAAIPALAIPAARARAGSARRPVPETGTGRG
jgi:EmrB/QacA subfamily drug resistance transporter